MTVSNDCASITVPQSLSKSLGITQSAIMPRGEHDNSDQLSSSALDVGAPSHTVYLISFISGIMAFRHVRICPLYAAEPS